MKKNNIGFLLIALVLLVGNVGVVRAQRPVGDTLACPSADSTYLYGYSWHPELESYVSNIVDLQRWGLGHINECDVSPRPFCGNHINGNQMYVTRPIKILGIAACVHIFTPTDTVINGCVLSNMVDTTLAGRITDSLILYTLTPNGPQMLEAGPWRMENPHRYMTLPMMDTFRLDIPTLVHEVIVPTDPLYEVMFDKPQVVTDSFIVAGTCNNNEKYWNERFCPSGDHSLGHHCMWEHIPTYYWNVYSWMEESPNPLDITWLYIDSEWHRCPWSAGFDSIQGILWWQDYYTIYPIIDPEFDTVLCDAVSDVRLIEATDTTLTLAWNGGNDVQWEVQYMEVNGWDVLTETTNVPMVTLTGLRERTNYVARVRGMCEWDTEYGAWSEWLDVYTGAHHDDPPQTIGNLARFTQMMPNPARGLVTVMSSYRLSRVVVYDLKGNTVLEQEDEGLTATFDVSTLAKGVYVVAIHTPAGIATKRLVVE